MYDSIGRNIDYLRISVTDRCNLRCQYCMPAEGIPLLPRADILSMEEIARLVEVAASLGIDKIRFTGGEPLLRKGVIELIRNCAATPGIRDIALTTNGVFLAAMVKGLKEAGLKRVNISLDTLDPNRFNAITHGGDLQLVLDSIRAAISAGLDPIKLNMVVMRGINDDEVLDMACLTLDLPVHVRFIELMPIGKTSTWAASHVVLTTEVRDKLRTLGGFAEEKEAIGRGPARYYRLPGAKGTVGFISALSDHFCSACNRLRLTASGRLRPCLYHSWEKDLRDPLRAGASKEQLACVFQEVVLAKPACHNFAHGCLDQKSMSEIGG